MLGRLRKSERDELIALRAELAEIRAAEAMETEITCSIKRGEFNLSMRSEWFRAFAATMGAYFMAGKAENYLEITMNPAGTPENPNGYPIENGPLLITLQRVYARTPAMILGDFRRFFDARFQQIKLEEIEDDGLYLCLLKPSKRPYPVLREQERLWHVVHGTVFTTGAGVTERYLRFDYSGTAVLSQDKGFDTIAELYRLGNPFTGRPERIPYEDAVYITTADICYYPRDPRSKNADKLEPGRIAVGTKGRLRNAPGPDGWRWYFLPEGLKGAENCRLQDVHSIAPVSFQVSEESPEIPQEYCLYVPDIDRSRV